MPNERVIYVPWPRHEASSLALRATRFQRNVRRAPTKEGKEAKTWKVVYFAPELDYFGALQKSDQIYVFGHGGNGSPAIFVGQRECPGHGYARFELVCHRLRENGLKPQFAGKIKFYNCSGALDAHGAVGPESFAGRAARLLRQMDFNQCRIFGYSAVLMDPDNYGVKQHAVRDGSGWLIQSTASAVRVEYGLRGEVLLPPEEEVERCYMEDEDPNWDQTNDKSGKESVHNKDRKA